MTLTAAEQLRAIVASQGPDAVAALERVRTRTGRHYGAFLWASDERSAGAFRACHAGSKGGELSCWRFTTPGRDGWRVAVLSEALALRARCGERFLASWAAG